MQPTVAQENAENSGAGVRHWYDGGWDFGSEPNRERSRSDGSAHGRAGGQYCDGNWRRGPDVLCLQEVQVHISARISSHTSPKRVSSVYCGA